MGCHVVCHLHGRPGVGYGEGMTDHEAIQNLLAKYCFLVDRGSAEDIGSLFWEDATVRFGDNVHHGSAEAIRGFDRWIRKMRDPVAGLRHVLHTPLIEIDGDRATAEAYYDADGHSRRRGRRISLRGVYRDVLVKRDGQWRFQERETQIWRSMLDHADDDA